jgi:glycosyltransferase involved in cell wall biosynthesis
MEHFLSQQWPEIRAQWPALQFHIYGSGLSQELAEQWSQRPGVVVEGWIANASDLYQRHRLFLAPLRSGAGIKGKVIAAAAHGIPQILSPLAAEATGLRHRQEVWIARTPADWLEAVSELCSNDSLWQEMSRASQRFTAEHYSRNRGLQMMQDAFERLELPVGSPA